MRRGDFFRMNKSGLELEEALLEALADSDSSTYDAKRRFAEEIWHAEDERHEILRSKSDRLATLPTLVLSALLGGGAAAMLTGLVHQVLPRAILIGALLLVALCGVTALFYAYKAQQVRLRQALNAGLPLEGHDSIEQWNQAVIAQILAKYKRRLQEAATMAFDTRLAMEWTQAMLIAAGVGGLATSVAWLYETGAQLVFLDWAAVIGALLVWGLLIRCLRFAPAAHKNA